MKKSRVVVFTFDERSRLENATERGYFSTLGSSPKRFIKVDVQSPATGEIKTISIPVLDKK